MNYKTPPTRKDLERQVHDLIKELEMSTFIGKGAMAENRELKDQLAELQAQNTVLRTTERRLTETENELEKTQELLEKKEARIKQMENMVKRLQRDLAESVDANKRADQWLDNLDQFVQREKGLRVGNLKRPGPGDAGPSTPSQPRRGRPRGESAVEMTNDGPSTSARKRITAPAATASAGLAAELFPEDLASETDGSGRNPASTRKKRKVFGEGDSRRNHDQYDPPKAATSTAMAKTRVPTLRERRPPIQLGIVKLETPSPAPASEPDDESDEDALGQY